jgi:hypothetical protein
MSSNASDDDPLTGIDPLRIQKWERLGVDCIEADLKNHSGLTYVGAQHTVEWAWSWVRHKRAEEAAGKDEVVTPKTNFLNIGNASDTRAVKPFFPDTNFFFEFKAASVLDWHQLLGVPADQCPDICLIVPPTVMTQIESHKREGKNRTRRRAHETSALLRKALTSPDHAVELRAAKPRVILRLPPPVVRVDFSKHPNLDEKNPDHRIALEYLQVSKTEPDLVLLTDDTLLILAARALGFEPILPPESWKLVPEKDERDKEIESLRAEIKALKQTFPDMSVTVLGSDKMETDRIIAAVQVFEPSAQDIDEAVARVKAAFPNSR